MLTDHWIIALLLAQLCMGGLLLRGSLSAIRILRHWDANIFNERQLALERETYLVSSILQISLGFQLLALVLFLATANIHLPDMLKGAMCATGVLGMGNGYWVLGLKLAALPIYAVFLSLNYLDGLAPNYPLTPTKYVWVFPSVLLFLADFALSIQYFAQLSPNIIATCCSVEFSGSAGSGFAEASDSTPPWGWLSICWGTALLLALGLRRQWNMRVLWPLGAAFIALNTWLLKRFFVKYIYGLPAHACLFDIFFAQYAYIGYAIYGSMLVLLFALTSKAALQEVAHRLPTSAAGLHASYATIALAALALSLAIPLAYWLAWQGDL